MPEMGNRQVLSDAAEFALDADSCGVVGRRLDAVEGGAALGVCVVVVVLLGLLLVRVWVSSERGSTLKSPAP
jgi:hypothetical protein